MSIRLSDAEKIIESVFAQAPDADCLTVVVLDIGGTVKALKRQDGGFTLDGTIAAGRAFGSLALSAGTSAQLRKFRDREPLMEVLVDSVVKASDGRMLVEAGGLRIRDADGSVIGALGVAGVAPDACHDLGAKAIVAAGFRTTLE